ncbi:hypothetical protein RFI_23799 [Reticulomyxa filosa]|uniref:Uncharacterized protein n=1 Tax=Reticulomyxa filosa TaxID=46433 RepID=X6MI72_RETFI|nr:hypothetical protein RFI_23799 [Reticulomyxa filosa]|eukprot:ETO13569.1 hypothetical protein RFI_23799 [Reticulomyxa filosa]
MKPLSLDEQKESTSMSNLMSSFRGHEDSKKWFSQIEIFSMDDTKQVSLWGNPQFRFAIVSSDKPSQVQDGSTQDTSTNSQIDIYSFLDLSKFNNIKTVTLNDHSPFCFFLYSKKKTKKKKHYYQLVCFVLSYDILTSAIVIQAKMLPEIRMSGDAQSLLANAMIATLDGDKKNCTDNSDTPSKRFTHKSKKKEDSESQTSHWANLQNGSFFLHFFFSFFNIKLNKDQMLCKCLLAMVSEPYFVTDTEPREKQQQVNLLDAVVWSDEDNESADNDKLYHEKKI